MREVTLGSLFDGIGGFPLSAVMHGVRPVWASEIESFPILVTKTRFPEMKHLGSVTDINGAEIEPVDILTFGSPCQDLSVAGAQKGIHEGKRSSLFFEAVRIIKEMRAHDRSSGRTGKHVRCRWAVWENVPGAFSSNKGRDFQAVLQSLCEVADPEVHIPFPEKGKWQPAGCIVGDGYSVAWRVYDAQYWGVPQRRKRIYLVADFASERAGEILFEREGVSRHSETSGEAWKGAAEDAQGGAGGSGGFVGLTNRGYPSGDKAETLRAGSHGAIQMCAMFMGGQGAKAMGSGYSDTVSPTLKHVPSGSNAVPDVVYPNIARTLTDEHDASPCIDRGQNVVVTESIGGRHERSVISDVAPCLKRTTCNHPPVICLQGNGIDRAYTAGSGCDGKGWRDGMAYTLNTIDRYAVVYDCRGNGDGGCVPTLTGDHENRVTDYTAVAVHPKTTGALCANSHPGSYTGQDAFNDMLPVVPADPPRKYIVRRLTPLECCRLQGYPDGWTENLAIDDPTEEKIEFFTEVWSCWAQINGTKPKSRAQVIKWLKNPQSESAEYKAYGNSLAIPCSSDVLGRIAREMLEEEDDAQ